MIKMISFVTILTFFIFKYILENIYLVVLKKNLES